MNLKHHALAPSTDAARAPLEALANPYRPIIVRMLIEDERLATPSEET